MRLPPHLTTAAAIGAAAAGLLALPLSAAPPPRATAVLAGGCFWGMEAVFEQVRGVTDVVTGYAGGNLATAAYEQVSGGDTGHAEGIRITYDPARVSYAELLKVFFSVAHDPTELNRQGPDVGPQYRSAIFPIDPDQRRVAEATIARLDRSGALSRPIATTVEAWQGFTPAEAYHQDFVARNPTHPYVVAHDLPKLAWLKQRFPELSR